MRGVLRFLRRFYRLLVPITIAAGIVAGTLVVHWLAQPNVTDSDYLNPTSTADVGGADLASALAAAHVTIRRTADIDQALDWARGGDTTLFVPAPSLLNEFSAAALTTMPSSTRVVVVDPPEQVLVAAAAPIDAVNDRWAEFPAAAGCSAPEAANAPRVGSDRHSYAGTTIVVSCYDGSVVRLGDTDMWLIGSADPFRNDRIGENDNRALVTALLSTKPTVIWLDNHDKQPKPDPGPRIANPFNKPLPLPSFGGRPPRQSLATLFPGWMWTVLGLLMLILLTLAIAASRRFGTPVTEPMPVSAKARETVEGRGRLYRKAKQPATTLNALRTIAVGQLPAILGVAATTPAGDLFGLAAARAAMPTETVEAILRTDEPRDNEELVAAVARLDNLMALLTDSSVLAHGMDRI